MPYDKATQMEQLRRRSKELKQVSAELADIKDWFEKHKIEYSYDFEPTISDLEDAINTVDDIEMDVDKEADVLEDEMEEEI